MAITAGAAPGNLLVRNEIWSKRIQEELQEELQANSLIEWITGEFSDGDMLTIPTLGSMTAREYTENADITIDDPTVGEFQLTIDKYYQAGVAVTDKMKEDTYYMQVLIQKFPEQCVRALMERIEADIFLLHKGQTTDNPNEINGVAHRFVCTGDVGGTNVSMAIADIAKAKLALDKANVSKNGRFAIVDPWVAYQLITLDSVIRQDVYGPNTQWKEGFGGTKFIGRYAGFDFYESNMLDTATALDHAGGGSLIANLFCGPEVFMGAVREMPEIESSRDWSKKRDVYHATCRYGLGLYRPESLVTILTTAV
jgi:hypothetical protein